MRNKVHVIVIKRDGRKFFEARWIDPQSGAKRTQTTKCTRRRDAERFALKLEEKLNSPEEESIQLATWKQFRQDYEDTVFPSQKEKTVLTTKSTFAAIEEILKPHSPQSITTAAVRKFTKEIRNRPSKKSPDVTVSEFTVARHLTELRKILNWAKDNRYIASVPVIRVPEAKGRKGRDVTTEEFERMLKAVSEVKHLKPDQWESYRFFLKGLWWGGLRLQEALLLDWQDDTHLCVDLNRRRPVFKIQATNDKGGKYRLLPMAPEFAELLQTVPESARVGRVFKLQSQSKMGFHLADRAGHIIAEIGKQAKVKVAEHGTVVKYATAHDLRRAFGVRWASRVLPPVLMELMRHADIKTTMQFYVGHNADRSAAEAWTAYEQTRAGNTTGNSEPAEHPEMLR